MSGIKWGLIGPGAIAQEFAQAMKETGGTLNAVSSRSLEKAKSFAEQYGAAGAYGDYRKMLRDSEIDAVYISTPHSNHYEYIIESLRQGKHVLAEKAITVNIGQLREIASLSKANGLVVAEAMTIYHMPLYAKLRQIVEEGKIGPLKMIQVSFGSHKEYDVNNRFFSKELAGGALLDIGTYALSFARFFLSRQPNEVLTTCKPFETGVDEQSGILLKNSADELAVISLTMRAKMPKRGIVAGENGFITVDNFPRASQAVVQYLDGTQDMILAGDTALALQYEIRDMEEAIRTGRTDTLELSLDVMEIMSRVREQWGLSYPFE